MLKGPKGQRRPADVIGNAVKVMRIATGEETDDVKDGRQRSGGEGPRSCNSRHVGIWAHAACMGNVPRFAPPAEVRGAVSPCVLDALAAYSA
jgi:hypothetical protein